MKWAIWSASSVTLFVLGAVVGNVGLPFHGSSVRQEEPPQVTQTEMVAAKVEPTGVRLAEPPLKEMLPVVKKEELLRKLTVPVSADRPLEEVAGRTKSSFGRKASIAPVPLHPVTEVLVKVGDTVKKDQVLVKLDSDEALADVQNKKAMLDGVTVQLKEAQRYLVSLEKAFQAGTVPESTVHTARMLALKAEHDEKVAKAALVASEAELEHFTITAPFAGVVSFLDVYPGLVSRPGTTVWGEILDLSEIDVQCDVTPEQADHLRVGQTADIRVSWKQSACGVAKVIFVGIAADKKTGLIPVLLRLPNSDGALRCDIPVQVRFTAKTSVEAAALPR